MKKNLLLLACLFFTTGISFAQRPEMAQAIVHYKFSHVRDTLNRDKPYTENMVLFLGPISSAYKSYDRKMQDALMRKQVEQQVADQKGSGGPMTIKVTGTKSTTRADIYQFQAQHKMVRKENLISNYLIEEPMPLINWKISNDTASFSTLHCQKATGHFGGRDYTAWFCPDMPYHTGPWKLNGLPGLIVEAYDTKKEVEFKFDGLEEIGKNSKPATTTDPATANPIGQAIKMLGDDPNQDPNLISLPTDAIKTTKKEFDNLLEAMRKDPKAFMASMGGAARMNTAPAAPGGGGGPQVVTVNNIAMGPRSINNPLELPEKK